MAGVGNLHWGPSPHEEEFACAGDVHEDSDSASTESFRGLLRDNGPEDLCPKCVEIFNRSVRTPKCNMRVVVAWKDTDWKPDPSRPGKLMEVTIGKSVVWKNAVRPSVLSIVEMKARLWAKKHVEAESAVYSYPMTERHPLELARDAIVGAVTVARIPVRVLR